MQRVSDALNKALSDLSSATAAASQAKALASSAQANTSGSDDRIKAAARVYAKSVLTFNQAAEEHVKTFGSKKSELLKSNADIIDCAHYGGCNNNENGVGGVGVNVDKTDTMIGHRNAVKSAAVPLTNRTQTFGFINRLPTKPLSRSVPLKRPCIAQQRAQIAPIAGPDSATTYVSSLLAVAEVDPDVKKMGTALCTNCIFAYSGSPVPCLCGPK